MRLRIPVFPASIIFSIAFVFVATLTSINTDQAASEYHASFTGDTKVLLVNGKEKTLEEIKPGEMVYAFDERINKRVTRRVLKKASGYETTWYRINDLLTATPEHRFRVGKDWIRADTLKLGDMLTDSEGKPVQVVSLDLIQEKKVKFNVLIEDVKTYYANGILVHSVTRPGK